MKILFIITRSDEIGGAHIHVRDMCLWLKERSHAVKVLVGGNGVFCRELNKCGIDYESLENLVKPISPFRDVKAIAEVRKYIQNYSPDILSLHSAKAGLIGRLANIGNDIRCVFTVHGWSLLNEPPSMLRLIFKNLEKFSAKHCDKIFTVCDRDRKLAIQEKICCPSIIQTIHNGIIDNHHKPRMSNADTINLVMVARFEFPKDHLTLARALCRIKHENWNLRLVGDGPLMDNYISTFQDLGLSHKVDFLGRLSDVSQILADSDIFLLISSWEGFPLSILEAMAARLPVIATNTGGISEAVMDGHNGFLVPIGNDEALALIIQNLLHNKELRSFMGKRGREKYIKQFTFDAMAQKYVTIYETLLRT